MSIQSVVFSKDLWSLSECKDWLKKNGFLADVDEKIHTYRFRQFDPIVGDRYASKRIDNGVTLVLSLRHGSGIFQNIKDFIRGVRRDFPPQVRHELEKQKNAIITEMYIYREPIIGAINAFLNKFVSKSFDQLYHLFMYVVLDNGSRLRIEKNQVIRISVGSPGAGDGVRINLGDKKLTMNDLMKNANPDNNPEFYLYDARNNNCQDYIIKLLEGSGLMTDELYSFIKQDVAHLIPGYLAKTGRVITDLAARLDVLKNGLGRILV